MSLPIIKSNLILVNTKMKFNLGETCQETLSNRYKAAELMLLFSDSLSLIISMLSLISNE